MKDTMEIIGRIAYLAEVNEWKLIEQIINKTKLDAFNAGMTKAAEVVMSLDGDDIFKPDVAIRNARDKLPTKDKLVIHNENTN